MQATECSRQRLVFLSNACLPEDEKVININTVKSVTYGNVGCSVVLCSKDRDPVKANSLHFEKVGTGRECDPFHFANKLGGV